MRKFLNFFLTYMVQKYQNEISPIFYYGKKLKTSGKLQKIPDLQPPDWGQPYWMTLYTFGLGSSIRYICVDIHKWYRYLPRSSTRWTTSSLARLTAGWTLASRTQPRWWRRHPPRRPCWRPPPWSWSSWRVSPHSVPWCHSYSSVA